MHGRGCGTGLAGQSVNAGIVFDFCDHLRTAAAEHGLTFSVDPATHDRCTLGGMIGNNSCGTHSVMGGKTVDNVLSLDVVTYDGTRMTVGPTDDDAYALAVGGSGRPAEIHRALRALRDRYYFVFP